MKKLEIFQELSVKLAILESKIDKLQQDINALKPQQFKVNKPNIATIGCVKCGRYDCASFFGGVCYSVPKVYNDVKCLWDSLSPEDRMKPMGLSCPCSKCSPYCLTDKVFAENGETITNPPRPFLKTEIKVSYDQVLKALELKDNE